MATRAKKKQAELLQSVREQLRNCYGWESDRVASDRRDAINYYFQRPRGDEVDGCSTVVSGDLSAMIEATAAMMMEAFSGPAVAEFDAYGAEDEDQAQLESTTVQHLVMGQNNGYLEFSKAIKDALLVRNGVMKVWVDERIRVESINLEKVTSDMLGEILQPPAPNVTIELTEYDPEAETATLKITVRNPEFKTCSIPPEHFFYPAHTQDFDLARCEFLAERHVTTRSHLIDRGYKRDLVESLPTWSPKTDPSDTMRKPGQYSPGSVGVDTSTESVEWFECYIQRDIDGDGIAELTRVCIGGEDQSILLSDDQVSVVPYIMGVAILNPHEVTGISLYDKLRQLQDVTTGLQRALLDNVEAINRPKIAALDGMVNQDDLDNQRVTGTIRVRASAGDVNRAVAPIVVPDISPGLLANLEYQRSIRTELGGASLDLATGNMQLNERLGSQGLDRAYSVMEQLSAFMTRTVAATLVRGVFLRAHEVLRAYYQYPIPIKMGGRWMAPVPAQWPPRKSVTLRVGMSPGERTRRSQALSTLAEHQFKMAESGMDNVLVNLDGYYNLVMDWARSQDIQNPERYYVDPRSQQSQQAQQAKQQGAMSQQQLQQAFLQQAVELEQMRTAMDKYRTDVQYQFEYWRETLRAEIEEAKIVGDATAQLLSNVDRSLQPLLPGMEPEEPGETEERE